MGRETKFGLLVGVVFIVLFGVILSGRAGSSAQAHAPLPTGESEGHRALAQTINRTVDPFLDDSALDVQGPSNVVVEEAVVPVEEALPAPERLESGEPKAIDPDDGGLLTFGPAVVETPVPGDGLLPVVRNDASSPSPAVPAASPTVHVVRRCETLIAIARRYYGKEGDREWRRIWEANKAAVPDPHRLAAGQELVIPDVPGGAPNPSPGEAAPPEPVPDTRVADRPAPAPATAPRVTVEDLAELLGGESDFLEHASRSAATYTVRPGDTFCRIAKSLYGDARKGRLLALKNKHLVPDEKKLAVGQRILLLDGVARDLVDSAVAQQ